MCRPTKSRVLHQHPSVAPASGLESQGVESFGPSVNLPGDPANFQLKIMRAEGVTEIVAVFFDGIGRFIFTAEQRYEQIH